MFKKVFIIWVLLFTINLLPKLTLAADPVTLPVGVQSTSAGVSTNGSLTYQSLVKIPGLGKDIDGKRVVIISPNSLGEYLQVGFNYFIGVAILLAVIMIIYGGVLYATTEAVTGKSNAKETIVGAAQGLALALGSYLILVTINPDLIKFQLDIGTVKLQKAGEGGAGSVKPLVGLEVLQNGELSGGNASGDGSNLLRVSGEAATNKALAQKIAQENGLSPTLFACQIGQESGFVPGRVSNKGASGIAQILPETARSSCPGINVSTVEGSLRCGAKIMSINQKRYSPDYARALAAYNGGDVAAKPSTQCASGYFYQCQIDKQGKPVPNDYGETRKYVSRISNCAAANGARL